MASKKRKCKDLISDCEFQNLFELLLTIEHVFLKLLVYSMYSWRVTINFLIIYIYCFINI